MLLISLSHFFQTSTDFVYAPVCQQPFQSEGHWLWLGQSFYCYPVLEGSNFLFSGNKWYLRMAYLKTSLCLPVKNCSFPRFSREGLSYTLTSPQRSASSYLTWDIEFTVLLEYLGTILHILVHQVKE